MPLDLLIEEAEVSLHSLPGHSALSLRSAFELIEASVDVFHARIQAMSLHTPSYLNDDKTSRPVRELILCNVLGGQVDDHVGDRKLDLLARSFDDAALEPA